MADTKTSDETAATTPTGAELVRVVQGGSSKQTTLAVAGHQLRGAKLHITADDTTVNATAGHVISWDAAVYDTDTFWSAGSPTRLTIPASKGITHVDIAAHVRVDASTAATGLQLLVQQLNSGGTAKRQFANGQFDKSGVTIFASVASIGVPVEDGDYFTASVTEESDTSITIESSVQQTEMTLVVRGMEPV